MIRLIGNLVFLVALIACAISVVTAQHRARGLFNALEVAQRHIETLEYDHTVVERDLAVKYTQGNIERLARDKLGMGMPNWRGRLEGDHRTVEKVKR